MKVLLHICCGPCALYIIRKLIACRYDVEGLFYNPNIHPQVEHDMRRDSAARLAAVLGIKLHLSKGYSPVDYFLAVKVKEEPARCNLCWGLRINETAEFASKNGFQGFTTTLLISPYQKHDDIKKISQHAAIRFSVDFIYEDYRMGFRQSHQLSRSMGLYHQKYCGCTYSKQDCLPVRQARLPVRQTRLPIRQEQPKEASG